MIVWCCDSTHNFVNIAVIDVFDYNVNIFCDIDENVGVVRSSSCHQWMDYKPTFTKMIVWCCDSTHNFGNITVIDGFDYNVNIFCDIDENVGVVRSSSCHKWMDYKPTFTKMIVWCCDSTHNFFNIAVIVGLYSQSFHKYCSTYILYNYNDQK